MVSKSGPHPGRDKPKTSLMFPLYSGSFELPGLYKHSSAPTPSRPPAAQTHNSCHLKETHQKASLKEKLQAAVFEEAGTKAFATSVVFRGSPGHSTKRLFSLGNPFFLPAASVSAKDDFSGSSAQAPQLGQTKPKCVFPATGGSAPLLAAQYQGSDRRALSVQLKSNREEPPLKSIRYPTVAVAEAWDHFHTRLSFFFAEDVQL